MTDVRIYSPAKSAMQSGRGNLGDWVLEYEPADAKRPDTLMGWAGSRDTSSQLRLKFDTLDEAIAYAEKKQLSYRVNKVHTRTPVIKAYADNFKYKG